MHKQKVDQGEIENIFLKQTRRVVVTTRRRSLHVGCKLQHPITFLTYIAFKLCRRISFCQVHSAPLSPEPSLRRPFAMADLRYGGPQSCTSTGTLLFLLHINDLTHQSLLHRLGYLLMTASYIAPTALVQTVRLCKGTLILWSGGV